jgi:hypothetical protein
MMAACVCDGATHSTMSNLRNLIHCQNHYLNRYSLLPYLLLYSPSARVLDRFAGAQLDLWVYPIVVDEGLLGLCVAFAVAAVDQQPGIDSD